MMKLNRWQTGCALLVLCAATAVAARAQTEVVLYDFCSLANCADGSLPEAGVIRDSEGNLYGTTFAGGANFMGAVYKLDTSGHETVLYSFCSLANCADGQYPYAGVIRDPAGNLYGTTADGGASGYGVLYEVDMSGHETVLYNFCSLAHCVDGQLPFFGVIRDSSGNLYGATTYSGPNGDGVVFKVDPSGHETVLYSFCSLPNCADGQLPGAGVIRDSEGNLYGTTAYGGVIRTVHCQPTDGCGAVYKLDPSGHETVLYSFCSSSSCPDGSIPYAGVIRDSQGNLYGTTYYGGAHGVGVVYKLDPSGHETVLYNFCSLANCADGLETATGVIRDSKGNLYGTTFYGGAHGDGVVYRVDASGHETVLYSFCSLANCADGSNPYAGLIGDGEDRLYGTATSGGEDGLYGVVFELKP